MKHIIVSLRPTTKGHIFIQILTMQLTIYANLAQKRVCNVCISWHHTVEIWFQTNHAQKVESNHNYQFVKKLFIYRKLKSLFTALRDNKKRNTKEWQ